jgi:hypothetical protein
VNNKKPLNKQQLLIALDLLNYQKVSKSLLNSILIKFDPNLNGIEFGEFVAICSFLLICNKIFVKFETDGKLEVDWNGLGCIGMWFI